MAYGAKGYILKPIVRKELLDNIQLCMEEIRRVHRAVQADLRKMGIETESDMRELLEAGRNTEDFAQMTVVYEEYFYNLYRLVSESAEKNDGKSISEVKKYIEEHYPENLTLEVMAAHFHMNIYYFSSFFKKNTGAAGESLM